MINNKDLNKLKIGTNQAAEMLEIHARTLRIYDKENVLKPSRSSGNHRFYSLEDLEKLDLIIMLTREFSCNLEAVKLILQMLEDLKLKTIAKKLNYIEKLAEKIGITKEIRQQNLRNNSKKGRKKGQWKIDLSLEYWMK